MTEQELIELIQSLDNLSNSQLQTYIQTTTNKRLKQAAINLLKSRPYQPQTGVNQFQENYEKARNSVTF